MVTYEHPDPVGDSRASEIQVATRRLRCSKDEEEGEKDKEPVAPAPRRTPSMSVLRSEKLGVNQEGEGMEAEPGPSSSASRAFSSS